MSLPAYAMNQSSFPEMYERELVHPLFEPFAELLLERVSLHAGDRVLDLACGTGIGARLAKARVGPEGRVVGMDVSAPMLEVAARIDPTVEWREGNATALPFAAGDTFDVVLCHQGLQFFPDKPAAAREMRRVLAPRGRLAVATWRPHEEIPFSFELLAVAERRLGPIPDSRYAFGDEAALERLLAEAGFRDIRVETVSRTVRFANGGVFVRMNAMALVGMSPRAVTMDEEERGRTLAAIVEESAEVLARYSNGTELAAEFRTNMATASG